ncbi:MAG: amidase, partial [Peptococcaceae bacterium]|nr:amidase [Peptococcaceae bacterium]
KNFDWVAAPPLANLTGNPSLSLPLQHSSTGLPIGLMFTARYLDEACLLRLAGQLERELPWRQRLPPLLAAV